MEQKKGFLQISFGWMFAIIVGAMIVFLAIYISTKLINTQEHTQDTKVAAEIKVLLDPLETGFETGRHNSFSLPVETRIYSSCESDEPFGKQIIQVSQMSFGKWTSAGEEISSQNRYIFSEKIVEGKKFYLFSKPFDFPFKVSDLVIMTSESDKYCFSGNIPDNIEEELKGKKQPNIFFDSEEDCKNAGEYIDVCFGNSGSCEIEVDYERERVEKDGKTVYFKGDSLMYAGIFSDPENYECQLQRLMLRLNQLSRIYQDKTLIVSDAGCNSNIDFLALGNAAKRVIGSQELGDFYYNYVNVAEDARDTSSCKIW